MVVYLDLVILTTIIADYAILRTISVVLKEKIIVYRLILALIFSVVNLFLFIFPFKHLMILRYFSGIVVVLFAYKYHNVKETIIKVIMYYLLNIAFIGTLIVFKVQSIGMLFCSLFLVVLSKLIENYKSLIINKNANIYKISINNKILQGYMDTGNTSYYKGIPVVYINDIFVAKFDFHKIGTINIQGINGESKINIYSGPAIIMNNSTQIVYYALNANIEYDIILHRDLK